MSNILEYKGYIASIEFSSDDMCLFGKIEYINDLILFDGSNPTEVEAAFHEAVDSYLSFCEERGTEPNQSFKGTFNIRCGMELHRKAAIEAKRRGSSLNDLVTKAIEAYLKEETIVHHEHIHTVTKTIEFEMASPSWGMDSGAITIGVPNKGRCH